MACAVTSARDPGLPADAGASVPPKDPKTRRASLVRRSRYIQPMPFVAEELVLYESVLTTGGPRYQSRLTLDLTN